MKQSMSAPASDHVLRTMGDVEIAIAKRRDAMTSHPFLVALNGPGQLENMRRVAPQVAFFVFGFQDVLRLVHSRSTDPVLKPLAEKHAREDAGHELWYLRDLERLGVDCSVSWLFSEEHRVARDVVYAQIAEVLRANHDHTRFAVALCLESLAGLYFDRAKSFLERIGAAEGLDYFGGRHLEAEQGHEIFETEAHRSLSTIPIPETARAEIIAAIDRVFASMDDLSTDLVRRFRQP